MSVATAVPLHDSTVLRRHTFDAVSQPLYLAAPLFAPTADQQQLRAFSRRALPIAQKISAQSVSELSNTPTPRVWADACDDYELARTSYAVDILGLDEYHGFGKLWTPTRNNIEPVHALCQSAYERLRVKSNTTSAFSPSKVWDSYFAALSAVVLQYWAFVNNRLFTYAPHKRGVARLFKQSMPDTLLLVYMSTDFEPVLLAPPASAKIPVAAAADSTDAKISDADADVAMSQPFADPDAKNEAEEQEEKDATPVETIASFAGRPLPDLVKNRSFADALLLVGAHYVELDADVLRMLSVYVLNTVARSTRLFLTSRGFNFFPWDDIEAIVKPAATRQLRTDHSQRIQAIPRKIVHWYPQQSTLAMERLVLPAQSTPTQVGAKMVPHLCAHARLSAFEPVFDIEAACGAGASEVANVASLLAQLRWFVPRGLDYTRILRGAAGDAETRLSDISTQLRGQAQTDVVQYLLNPVAHRYRFVVSHGRLLLQPPLQLRHREAVVSERSPLSVSAALLAFASFAVAHSELVFVVRPAGAVASPRLFYFVDSATKSVRRTVAPRDASPCLDPADEALVLAFSASDVEPVPAERVYEFFQAAVIMTRGDPVLTCALCMRYIDPDVAASPARVARLLHGQYRAAVRQHLQFVAGVSGPARDVVRYIRVDWDRLGAPRLRLQTDQMKAELLDLDTAQWLTKRLNPQAANAVAECMDALFSACVDAIRLSALSSTHPEFMYYTLAVEGLSLDHFAPFRVGTATFDSWASLRRFVEGFARHYVLQMRSFCVLAAQPVAVEWSLRPVDVAMLDQFTYLFSDTVQRVAPFARAAASLLPSAPMSAIEQAFFQFWTLLGSSTASPPGCARTADTKTRPAQPCPAALPPPVSRTEIAKMALPGSESSASSKLREMATEAIRLVLRRSCRIGPLEVRLVEKTLFPDEKQRALLPPVERAREIVSVLREAIVDVAAADGARSADAWAHFRWSSATKASDPLMQAVHDVLAKLPGRHGLPAVETVVAQPSVKRRARVPTDEAV